MQMSWVSQIRNITAGLGRQGQKPLLYYRLTIMPRRRTHVTAQAERFSKKSTLKVGVDRNGIAKRGIYALEACMERHQDENPACPSKLARREAHVRLAIGRSGISSCVYARGTIRNAQPGTRE